MGAGADADAAEPLGREPGRRERARHGVAEGREPFLGILLRPARAGHRGRDGRRRLALRPALPVDHRRLQAASAEINAEKMTLPRLSLAAHDGLRRTV